MSNASLKDQLQAVASQISVKKGQNENKKSRPPKSSKIENKNNSSEKPSTSKSKPTWLIQVQYGVELLRVYFPQAFKGANEIKPLKKGIKEDLIKQLSTLQQIVTEDKACMIKSLAYYVNTNAYHKNVIEGAVRIDLEGNPAGLVSAEEAKYSSERYQAKLQAKQTQQPPTLLAPATQDKV